MAIYRFNPEDPMNPEINVPGVGNYNLRSLKSHVQKKLVHLAEIANHEDPYYWRQLGWWIDNEAIIPQIKAINEAHDELQAIRRKGGKKSRGISKEPF